MKKILSLFLFPLLLCIAASAQEKKPPAKELKSQANHVKSSGNDLLHFRFKKAHEKHVAEMKRRNRGIAKDLNGQGAPPPRPAAPPAPKKIVIH